MCHNWWKWWSPGAISGFYSGLREIPDKLFWCLCTQTRCLLLRYPRSKTKIQTPSYDRIAGIPASRKTTTGLSSGRWSLGTSSSLVVNSGKLVVSSVPQNCRLPRKPVYLLTFYDARYVFGGEGGIRTPAPVARPKALAKPPLRPLGYFSMPAKRIIT